MYTADEALYASQVLGVAPGAIDYDELAEVMTELDPYRAADPYAVADGAMRQLAEEYAGLVRENPRTASDLVEVKERGHDPFTHITKASVRYLSGSHKIEVRDMSSRRLAKSGTFHAYPPGTEVVTVYSLFVGHDTPRVGIGKDTHLHFAKRQHRRAPPGTVTTLGMDWAAGRAAREAAGYDWMQEVGTWVSRGGDETNLMYGTLEAPHPSAAFKAREKQALDFAVRLYKERYRAWWAKLSPDVRQAIMQRHVQHLAEREAFRIATLERKAKEAKHRAAVEKRLRAKA